MPTNRNYIQHPATSYDIPLPGMMSCLTMQLNITRYRAAGTYRWTLSVREPVDNVEVYRQFGDTDDYAITHTPGQLSVELGQALYNIDYLMGLTGH